MVEAACVVDRVARRRVPIGFAVGALILWFADPTPVTLLLGAPVAALGEAIRIWAAGHLNKAREVTVSGPYRWFAHPLYVGSSIMAAGLAIACASPLVAGLIAVYLIVAFTAAVRSEEAFLRQKFSDRYERYRRGEPTGAGGGGASGNDEQRRFSVACAMSNREYRAVVGLVLVVLWLALKATYNEPS